MKVQHTVPFIPLLLILCSPFARADTIFLSATSGTNSGFSIGQGQIVGVPFHLDSSVIAQSIGGEFVGADDKGQFSTSFGNGMIFGAIVRLSSPTDIPDSSFPLNTSDVLAHTLIPVSAPYADTSASIGPITLDAGDYALVFGSDQLGATGSAFLFGGTDIGTPLSFYVESASGQYVHNAHAPEAPDSRVFLSGTAEATPLPAPALGGMMLLGTLGGGVWIKNRRAALTN
jgi:hypothetical protein